MSGWKLVSLSVIFFAASLYIIAACGPEGPEGKQGPPGEDGSNAADDNGDDADDSGVATDDASDDTMPDDDGTDDDALEPGDLPYAEDCPDLATCVVSNCQSTPDPDSYALLQCTLVNCSDEYAACFGAYGTGACVQILKCLQACLPEDCLQECLAPASYDSMLQFADVGICVEDNCPEALADPLHNVGCFIGVCADPVAICCGGTIMGCM